jgi:hypothetical protein
VADGTGTQVLDAGKFTVTHYAPMSDQHQSLSAGALVDIQVVSSTVGPVRAIVIGTLTLPHCVPQFVVLTLRGMAVCDSSRCCHIIVPRPQSPDDELPASWKQQFVPIALSQLFTGTFVPLQFTPVLLPGPHQAAQKSPGK